MNAKEMVRVLFAFALICLAGICCACGSPASAILAGVTAGMLLATSAMTDWEGGK